MRLAARVVLTEEVRAELVRLSRSRSAALRLVERSRIVLLAADGRQNKEIAEALQILPKTVSLWRSRFAQWGLKGIRKNASRRGGKPETPKALVSEIVRMTTLERPANASHWSTRTMAKAVGVSASTIRKIWQLQGLKPHLSRTFKLSNDPDFAAKVEDVVGLYLSPPQNAIVLSADEKSQIQALDRTQPGLPMKKGRAGTMTHDYKRHGTTTLFAAMNVLTGRVIGTCMKRHSHKEWLKFLRLIDVSTPPQKQLHLIVDNYATHKHPAVKRWLSRHPRFHMHFTPTSGSWLNMVERFFRDIGEKAIRRCAFQSVDQLIVAIHAYLEAHNASPKPFIWTAKATDILEKVKRARASLPLKTH
jgi:transposase